MNEATLTGRRALVIGAGTPAGRSIALALAEAGADVAVAASSLDGEEVMACRRTRRAIEKLGRRSAEYAFDVTLGQNVQVSTRQVAKEMGGLDILVYAVHAPFSGASDRVTDAEWTRCLTINLSGAFFAARAALREMLPRGWGRIILVSQGPVESWPEHAALSAAEFGLQGLRLSLSEEFRGRGVQVHTIAIAQRQKVEAPPDSDWQPPWPLEAGAFAAYVCSPAADDFGTKTVAAYLDPRA